ncbi:beta-lactamase family protein [Chitinophaga varians]|uniref:Beta-lactamase family protein n=1 Tax=Chitinophaga varians TaxID=2202339 RepID=A0A847S2W0_9BACT|nr:serine hydrolase domain-containing protein [Chitinophaga varians]NLR69216.1 beta-lactamase family protein [Chitinophaga varians]
MDALKNIITDSKYPNLYSLLIYQKDDLIYEHYFPGHQADSLFDIRSSFKSILSLLAGISIDKGYLHSLDDKVFQYFHNSAYAAFFTGPKKEITLRHLLAMKSGLICEEFFSSHDCETPMEESENWIAFCLDRPMAHKPGQRWSYSTCNALIAGAVIEAATGKPLADFAAEHLFAPLGIRDYRWTQDPSGNYMSGGSFFMTGPDMLKIGQLVLHNGYFLDKHIISSEYLHIATSPITGIPSFSFVGQSGLTDTLCKPAYYGLCWYTESVKAGNRYYTCQFSSGNGGQYILVIRELALVVVCTQGNFDSRQAKQFFEILVNYIIPAVRY